MGAGAATATPRKPVRHMNSVDAVLMVATMVVAAAVVCDGGGGRWQAKLAARTRQDETRQSRCSLYVDLRRRPDLSIYAHRSVALLSSLLRALL